MHIPTFTWQGHCNVCFKDIVQINVVEIDQVYKLGHVSWENKQIGIGFSRLASFPREFLVICRVNNTASLPCLSVTEQLGGKVVCYSLDILPFV